MRFLFNERDLEPAFSKGLSCISSYSMSTIMMDTFGSLTDYIKTKEKLFQML